MAKVLIADDERAVCDALGEVLRREGHSPLVAASGAQALEMAASEDPAAVLLDVRMPGMDGLEVLAELRRDHPALPVVVMTAYGTMETAMQAMRLGAFDYLGKPLELERIRSVLARALHRCDGVPAAPSEAADAAEEPQMVGQGPAMQEIFKLMSLLTENDLTVLVTGESGVGKELVARGIHRHGSRRDEPFVAVNCAAVPEHLLESELFGHERGAFTGAEARRMGRFEAAAGGTVFLDEVGELPLHLQGKLLRVLQERSFERVGSVAPQPVKARVIAATHRDLESEVAERRFREDLYYRLKLVTLAIPPLRRRREDIPALARHFLRQGSRDLGRQVHDIEPAALEALQRHPWPGNVRELEHAIKRALLTARGPLLSVHDLDLPATLVNDGNDAGEAFETLRRATQHTLHALLEAEPQPGTPTGRGAFHRIVDFVEAELVEEALRLADGNQVAASQRLGLHRTTLRNKRRT